MSAAVGVPRARPIARIRPRVRRRETGLLILVGVILVLGSVSLGATQRQLAGQAVSWLPADAGQLVIYLGALVAAHLALVLAGRRSDQVLLPTIGLLGGISLLLMERLPQSLVTQSLAGRSFGLASIQLGWLILAIAVITIAAISVRSDAWLRRYKYTWAAAGIVLLLLTFLFGNEVNGALLTITVGPFSGQPTELIKVVLVIFLAGYLSDFRPLLVSASMRLGPLRLPPVPYLLPMFAMWAMALGIVVIQRDLGAALLFFAVFLALVYIATARASYVVLGLILFVAGSVIAYQLFGTVRDRVDIWLNPFVDASGKGYQVVQSLYAFGRGGIIGTGLGAGLPLVGGRLPIPAIHTDFPFAALGEELGLIGVVAILGLYLVVIERGLRVAASAADDFRALLAAGLTLVVGVQAFIIAAGNLKLIPLTGVTLPFISYGGSSLLANGVVVGLLLALSDRGVEPPPPPRPARGRRPAFLGGAPKGAR
ncbi:MAG TPA: FtsW/RodA/SpoVE family cell cycle protein [Candidatus Limnocylindrales bacterium]